MTSSTPDPAEGIIGHSQKSPLAEKKEATPSSKVNKVV